MLLVKEDTAKLVAGTLFTFLCMSASLFYSLKFITSGKHITSLTLENPPCLVLCGSSPGVHEKLHDLPEMSRVALVRRAGTRLKEGTKQNIFHPKDLYRNGADTVEVHPDHLTFWSDLLYKCGLQFR